MDIVLSGIRPTGQLHLGNYFGALRNFVRMQYDAKCYFFIADYHAMTTHTDPAHLHDHVKTILSEYLAAGINPDNWSAPLRSRTRCARIPTTSMPVC